ncbi:hypothetical protein B9G98_04031 [Wickerhamiella sorbophila]|uniref:Uncharacterized protein n=1 Tax=Wickerhamiella sorbophila TaxID=45607 RepID=A0A2T0FN43_9ASCO|nr:hypothetical protein B9G98_04031 [Wickerhamiella sorbophila]PRT56411.1 hypothetical protein B9G98_04031 [Wickerhamiella sorbophila]
MPRLANSPPGLSRQRSLLSAFRLKKQPAKPGKPLQISDPILITSDSMDSDRFSAYLCESARTPECQIDQQSFSPAFLASDWTGSSPSQCNSPPDLIDAEWCPDSPGSFDFRGHSRDNSESTAYWSSVKDDDEESVYSTLDSDYVSGDEDCDAMAYESPSIHTVERVYFRRPSVQSIWHVSEPSSIVV